MRAVTKDVITGNVCLCVHMFVCVWRKHMSLPADLLILRVFSVVVGADGQHHHTLPSLLLEVLRDGNGRAFSHQLRLHSKH